MHISYTTIGRNIRTARQQAALTQEALAERLKISHLHFGRLERGERPISLELLAQLADALGVSLSALMCGCVTGEELTLGASDDAQALGQSVAALAAGCSQRTRDLMLAVCKSIAESEKQTPEKREAL